MSNQHVPLEIRLHLVDARVMTYAVASESEAARIFEQITPSRFFESRQISIGCAGTLSVFQSSYISQVELISDHVPDWSFHHNVRMIQEVSAQAFREKYAHIDRVDRTLSDIVHVSSEIELSNGETIYLTLEVNNLPAISPLTPLDQHMFLQQLFTSHGIYAFHQDRGLVLINPSHIVRLTMHPGPESVPTGAWHAKQTV